MHRGLLYTRTKRQRLHPGSSLGASSTPWRWARTRPLLVVLMLLVVAIGCSDDADEGTNDTLQDVAEAPDTASDGATPVDTIAELISMDSIEVSPLLDTTPPADTMETTDTLEEVTPPEPFALVHQFPPVGPLDVPYEHQLTATGGVEPYSDWAVTKGTLPAGSELDPATGLLSGTPTEAGLAYFVIEALDAEGTADTELFGLRTGDAEAVGPLLQKARDYQDVYAAKHIWNGLSLGALYPDATDGNYGLLVYGDAAFVSGNCLMGAAFRYAVEKTPEAADNLALHVTGMKNLHDVTGVEGLFGRSFAHKDDPYTPNHFQTFWPDDPDSYYYYGAEGYEDFYWRGDVSRDQYSGIVLGLAMAYDLADDPEVKATAAELMLAIVDHLWANDLKIIDADGEPTTHGNMDAEQLEGAPIPNGLNAVCLLAWFKIAAHISGDDAYQAKYEELAFDRGYLDFLSDYAWYWASYGTKYYNVYMAFENWFHLVRLEEDPAIKQILVDKFAETMWYDKTDDPKDRRAESFANPTYINWYSFATGDVKPEHLWEAVWQVAVFQDPPLRDKYVQNSLDPTIEKNPDNPAESLYPLPSYLRKPDMVIWHRNPFELDGGADTDEERTGNDYMLPYWMGRYYGYISADW